MAETRNTEIPEPPEWVKEAGPEEVWAWEESPVWRCAAENATEEDYREFLMIKAKDAYWTAYWLT